MASQRRSVAQSRWGGSIGFGAERLSSVALRAPRLGLAVIALLTLVAAIFAANLHVGDAPRKLYAPAAEALAALAPEPFLDPADMVVLLAQGGTAQDQFAALTGAVGTDVLLDHHALATVVAALPPPTIADIYADPGAAAEEPALIDHGVDALVAALIGPRADDALLIAPKAGARPLQTARAAISAAPEATLTGLPVARLTLVETLTAQQPLLWIGDGSQRRSAR